jgi:hypothetical protein
MDYDLDTRIKALELAAAAVTAGHVHYYDAIHLAREYLLFLSGTDGQQPDDGDTETVTDTSGAVHAIPKRKN